MKNLPALALALVCTTGLFVAPAAHAASASITFPTTINLNLSAGITPNEDVPTRLTTITSYDANGNSSNPIAPSPNWNPVTYAVGGKDLAGSNSSSMFVSSPGQDLMVSVTRTTSFDFQFANGVVGQTAGTGSVSFDYDLNFDANPNAFLNASVIMTIFHPTVDSQGNAVTATSTFQKSISVGDIGKLTVDFNFFAGDSGVLQVDLLAGGAPAAAPVPVPAALPLLVSALAGVAGMSKRRRNKGAQI